MKKGYVKRTYKGKPIYLPIPTLEIHDKIENEVSYSYSKGFEGYPPYTFDVFEETINEHHFPTVNKKKLKWKKLLDDNDIEYLIHVKIATRNKKEAICYHFLKM